MAPSRATTNKRKRSSVTRSTPTNSPATPRSPPRKRKKKETPLREDTPPADPDEFFSARSILDENKTQYKIDWEDHPVTGKSYSPTWEPKGNANQLLVADWNRKKLAEEEPRQKKPKLASTSTRKRSSIGTTASPVSSRKPKSPILRRRKIVQSASPTPESEFQLELQQASEPNQAQEQEHFEEPETQPDQLPVVSSASQDPIVIPETALRIRAEVVITQPTDYNPSEYEQFTTSQVPWGTQEAPASSPHQETNYIAGSSQAPSSPQPGSYHGNYVPAEELLRQPRFADGEVIPDSESLHENSSYIPSTQTCSNSNPSQSNPTQAEQANFAATQAQQDTSASASAEFTQSGQDDSSAPVPETDPIEEVHSSPAHSPQRPAAPTVPSPESRLPGQVRSTPEESQAQEDQEASARIPATAEQGTETVSAASDKQTQEPDAEEEPKELSPENRAQGQDEATVRTDASETQEEEHLWIANSHEQEVETVFATASEHAPELEAEEEQRAASPAPGSQEQGSVTLETEAQEISTTEQITQEPDAQGEICDVQATAEEGTESQAQGNSAIEQITQEPDVQEGTSFVQATAEEGTGSRAQEITATKQVTQEPDVQEETSYVQDVAEEEAESQVRENSVIEQVTQEPDVREETCNTQDIAGEGTESGAQEKLATNQVTQEPDVQEKVCNAQDTAGEGADSEVQEHFVAKQATQEPDQEPNVQEEICHTQDIARRDTESETLKARAHQPELNHLNQPSTEPEPEEADEGASGHLTSSLDPFARESLEQFSLQQSSSEQWQAAQAVSQYNFEGTLSGPNPADQPESITQAPVEKRKDSSQTVESGILSQADPNVVRHSVNHRANSPKDVVSSVESQTELFTSRYGRRSQGMTQSPQPGSSSVTDRVDPETPSLAGQLRELYARGKRDRAKKKAEVDARYGVEETEPPSLEDSTRSPSIIPPQIPQQTIKPQDPQQTMEPQNPQQTKEPQFTAMPSDLSAEVQPTQHEDALPDIQHPAEDVEMDDGSTPSVLLDEPTVGEAEHLIALSMEGIQGDQYRREINFKKDAITDFTENENPKEQSLHEVQELLKKAGNVVTHIDLGFDDEDALTQYDTGAQGMLSWTNHSSTKFRFLGGVLEGLRHLKLHFVILGRPGMLIDIIETFVRGMGIDYSRDGKIDRQAFDARASPFVTIIATDFEEVDQSIPAADLIFAMDSSVQCRDPKIKALRNHLRGARDTIPVITPIANNSLEHVERCVATSLKGPVRMKLVVRFMTELRQMAGRVDGSTKADHAVKLVVPSIETDLDHHEAWPLPRVGSIKGLVTFDESMLSSLTVSSSALVDSGTVGTSAGQKRHLETEGEEPAKKARLTPQPGSDTVNPIDITHISDSLLTTSQTIDGQSSSNNPNDKDEQLRKELIYTKQRLEQFEFLLHERQTLKEDQDKQIFFLKKENTELKQSQLIIKERLHNRDDTIASLKQERTTLQQALDEARTQLASSTIPAVAEFEQLRRERDDRQAKLERAQRVNEANSRELDFFRAQYQDATNTATDATNEVAAMHRKLRDLERTASGEGEKARSLSLRAAQDAYADEVAQLSAQLKANQELVKLKDGEIKALRGRQGVGTRAGSVPRSPRVVGGGPGSRGGSPAPSGLGGRVERLRNLNA